MSCRERKILRMHFNHIIGKNIVVIDDIYTTGSTIDECTKILIEAGAHNVHFITLSIGAGY